MDETCTCKHQRQSHDFGFQRCTWPNCDCPRYDGPFLMQFSIVLTEEQAEAIRDAINAELQQRAQFRAARDARCP